MARTISSRQVYGDASSSTPFTAVHTLCHDQVEEARVITQTLYDNPTNRIGILFKCTRLVPTIDPQMSRIFTNAVNGNAHFDMTQNAFCGHEQETGMCGNLRGALSECRCEALNRVAHPVMRTNYENQVISAFLNFIDTSTSSFHVKLAIFCSGGLLGEEILLLRLIDKLKKQNASGVVEIFLIDTCYEKAIKSSFQEGNLNSSVGGEKYLEQFLTEMSQILPKNITLRGAFFDDAQTYIKMAETHPEFKHHLLIGADIGNTNMIMGEIGKRSGLGVSAPITLIKTEIGQKLCELDSEGSFKNCCDPRIGQGIPTQASTEEKDHRLTYILVGVTVVIVIGIILTVYLHPKSKNGAS